ncbi:MAG: FAD-dependent oxidoreductase [Coriobacteriaceae bacterium]|nr:FAD-dependent oxidoreductase [Coriobacteriaceae bacterium]
MLEAAEIALPLDAGIPGNEHLIGEALAFALGVVPRQIETFRVVKRSVDARKRNRVCFVATIAFSLASRDEEEKLLASLDIPPLRQHIPYEPLEIPRQKAAASVPECQKAHKPALECPGVRKLEPECPEVREPGPECQKAHKPALECPATPASFVRPVVVGMGPAGLFAALYLAKAGLKPLVLERGCAVDQRMHDVEAFQAGGPLIRESNIQFGEGGAGTFSDGKLTTNIKSPYRAHILRWLVEAGAPEEIEWQAKPHIGTDNLISVVQAMRQQIVQMGGEVCFSSRLDALYLKEGRLSGIGVTSTKEAGRTKMKAATHLVLAVGHSARDTFAMLFDAGLELHQKAFSVGVRIEHEQTLIDRTQYGVCAGHPALGASEYKLAVHLGSPGSKPSRSVYTFCMCPGGEVVCAASEEGGVAVNGMSRFSREGKNANSAVLVNVEPRDLGSSDPLAGIAFQRRIEQAAYRLACANGGKPYDAPVQRLGDFLAGASSLSGKAEPFPSYARGVVWCDLRQCLPPFVVDALVEAFPLLDRKLRGFASKNAVLTGVETRSSSPVRIWRDKNLQAVLRPSSQDAPDSGRPSSQDAPDSGRLSSQDAPDPGRPSSQDAPDPNAMPSQDALASEAPHAGSSDQSGFSLRGSGIYPCGEGAGYAGGIMSAAADGLKVAEALVRHIREAG